MEQLQITKSDFLLEAPLEILHEESVEWLEEIEFWKDECAFLYKLITQKLKDAKELFNSKRAKVAEKHLIYISTDKLDALQREVKAHEKFLSYTIESMEMDEQLYRSRHKEISKKFGDFEMEFKGMKKQIFSLANKEVKKNGKR